MKAAAWLMAFSLAGAHAEDGAHTLALKTPEGDLVGFMLGAGSLDDDRGECLFAFAPLDGAAARTPLAIVVSELRVSGEHHWTNSGGTITVSDGAGMLLRIDTSGNIIDASGTVIGAAFVPDPSD